MPENNKARDMVKAPLCHDELLGKRSSGVLLHIASLPSKFGIGDFGDIAYTFADKLVEAGQKYWQILPLNPSNSYSGESPYFSSSAFAGNPLLISLEKLVKDGLLYDEELAVDTIFSAKEIDYAKVRPLKLRLIERAANRFSVNAEFEKFCETHKAWLNDYALFIACKNHFPYMSWSEWPKEIRDRDTNRLSNLENELKNEIHAHKVTQYLFFKQWFELKRYCNNKGLLIFGDMPIYVSYDSADVWSHSQLFKLDEERQPVKVSGVPPDYFSATGQLWNNPVYNWQAIQRENYTWWVHRMGALFELYDILRIDHFRGLVKYWEVDAGSDTAIHGDWQEVPSYEFFESIKAAHPHFPVVVEDFGYITDDVITVKNHYQFPGMLILQFAFNDENNPYAPNNHSENAVVYLGSHDNTTGRDWFENISQGEKNRLANYVNLSDDEQNITSKLIELVMSSPANIAIITAQDLLDLPGDARINDPSINTGNWKWRMTQQEFDTLPLDWFKDLTLNHQRFHRD